MSYTNRSYYQTTSYLGVIYANQQGVKEKSSNDYPFGFQGQEKLNEMYGEGNAYGFEYRIHDPRIGRFFTMDPLSPQYPHVSPYAFQENKVGLGREIEGLETHYGHYLENTGDDMTRVQARQDAGAGIAAMGGVAVIIAGGGYLVYEAIPVLTGFGSAAAAYFSTPQGQMTAAEGFSFAANLFYDGPDDVFPTPGPGGEIGKVTNKIGRFVITKGMAMLEKIGIRKDFAKYTFQQAGKKDAELDNLMNTIDFNKKVKETTFNEGDLIYRYEKKGAESTDKNFFTDAYGADSPLGAGSVGFSDPSMYELVTYKVTKSTTVMQSTIKGTGTTQYFSTGLQNNIQKVATE